MSLWRKYQHNTAGLTLIELLVVMAIIGLLATIVYASFGDARAQSRDKIRMTSLKELQLAVEQFRAQTGRYPAMGCTPAANQWTSPGPGTETYYHSCDAYIAGLVPDYINALPRDPKDELVNDRGFFYQTNAAGTAYKIMVHRTVESLLITSFGDEFSRCPTQVGACLPGVADNANVYAVYSIGAEGW